MNNDEMKEVYCAEHASGVILRRVSGQEDQGVRDAGSDTARTHGVVAGDVWSVRREDCSSHWVGGLFRPQFYREGVAPRISRCWWEGCIDVTGGGCQVNWTVRRGC